ncbi:MBL fold metallo-hydrolase [Streptomyces sp. NPDC051921]|uniref:MBL fold metallo-hydrolase n=1 Tax=Streptomyces sp. NPDC051921 TaxID=3155806 RepID=UPI0034204E57
MRIHHLNCGSVRTIDPTYDGPASLPAVNHCLLVETDADGLVLVETGLGLGDVRDPEAALGADWVAMAQPALDEEETAVRQVARLGYDPADVRHILLTHLDVDHCGGLPDFPGARVHVLAAELAAARAESPSYRYRPAHWSHEPDWVTYDLADAGEAGPTGPIDLTGPASPTVPAGPTGPTVPSGPAIPAGPAIPTGSTDPTLPTGPNDRPSGSTGATGATGPAAPPTAEDWYGFTSLRLEGLPPEFRLVPLGGHTAGHTGVAVRGADRWLLHCGDAYYYHREMEAAKEPHPLMDVVQTSSQVHRDLRIGTQARLRELVRDHGDEVTVFSAHDPWEFARLAAGRA